MPYRTASRPEPPPEPGGSDDRLILWVGLTVGTIAWVPELAAGRRMWGTQPTLGMLVFLTCAGLLARDYFSALRRRLRARRDRRAKEEADPP